MTRFISEKGCFETSSKTELCKAKYSAELQIDVNDMYGINISRLVQVLLDGKEQQKEFGEFQIVMNLPSDFSCCAIELVKKD